MMQYALYVPNFSQEIEQRSLCQLYSRDLLGRVCHNGWELISGMFTDFVSSIDVVMRRVPGTQCEYILKVIIGLARPSSTETSRAYRFG